MSVQVPKGYKQTEVGVIPEDWDLIKLGDVCEIKGRIGFRGYTVNDIVDKGYGAISISPSNINNGKINFEKSTYISFDKYEESPEIKIFNGDIVLVKTGSTFGKVALVDGLSDKATLNPQVVVAKRIKINNLYLSFLMRFETFQSQISSSVVGGALPTLSQKLVEKFKIPCPPTSAEQMAVGKALSDADALIESLEQLIAKKRQIKQGAMQELLTGQRRLPGFSGEWARRRLGEICSMKSGFSITSDDIDEFSEYPCYGGNGLRGYTSTKTHSGKYVLIGRQGALCGNVVLVDGDFFASEHAIVVTPSHNLDIAWFSYILERMNLNQYSESSAQPGLSVSKLLLLEEKFPPKDEQIEIANFLLAIEEEIQSLVNRLNKARQIKQSMMQELLTGRIRLI